MCAKFRTIPIANNDLARGGGSRTYAPLCRSILKMHLQIEMHRS